MKVLWLSHVAPSSEGWQGSRQQHLARHLSQTCELHWIDWTRGWSRATSGKVDVPQLGTVHGCQVPPTLNRIARRHYPPDWSLVLSQASYRKAIKRVIDLERPNVIVWSSSHHMTGYPPFDTGVPAVYDHIDACPQWVVATFASHSDEIIVVSPNLLESVSRAKVPVHVVPNGVELKRYVALDRLEAKRSLGLEGTNVVSLIGLTCSPDLYFVDAVAKTQDIANLSLLIVGGGRNADAIRSKAIALGIRRFVAVGPVPSSDVVRFFAASDIGLYPGEDIEYYRHASPLKIVEYAAAGCQVVSSPVDMFIDGWPCVRITPPTADNFASSILECISHPRQAPDLSPLGWETLSADFYAVLKRVALGSAQTSGSRGK
ncbi:MAG: glycosyltransferase [Chlorobia bacterium]|nr:glycosyltransferase [Fimbriimonadaceae bacterium]